MVVIPVDNLSGKLGLWKRVNMMVLFSQSNWDDIPAGSKRVNNARILVFQICQKLLVDSTVADEAEILILIDL